MPGAGDREKPRVFGDGNLVCKKQVGHAISVPDREERHLLSEDLGSGEPVSRASARRIQYVADNELSKRVKAQGSLPA